MYLQYICSQTKVFERFTRLGFIESHTHETNTINQIRRFWQRLVSATRSRHVPRSPCEARKWYIRVETSDVRARYRDTYLDTTGWTVCKPDCPEHRTLTLPFPIACPRRVSIFPRCSHSAAWSIDRPANTFIKCNARGDALDRGQSLVSRGTRVLGRRRTTSRERRSVVKRVFTVV